MDMESEANFADGYTQQEQLVARLSPETEIEERLTRQIAFCSTKLEHIEALLGKAKERVHNLQSDLTDEAALSGSPDAG